MLGLSRSFAPQAVRIADYLALLRGFDDGERFYSRSFQIDPWGTTAFLLRLRDEAVAAGWRPDSHDQGQSERLKTLATLEERCANEETRTVEGTHKSARRLSCITDLGPAVLTALEAGARVPIDEISLVDRLEHLPPIWRRMLKALQEAGVKVDQLSLVALADDSDMSRLGASLAAHSPRCSLAGDGTFVIAEADDEVQAADLLTSWLHADNSLDRTTVIIRGSSTSFLDQLLHKAGLPRIGCNRTSSQRSFLQLLPLFLEMSWRPLAVDRYVEFLSLPNSPIPRFAADCFLRALRHQPGIGGGAWQEAWRTALSRKQKALLQQEEIDAASLQKSLAESESAWRQWLEPPCCATEAGMPAAYVVSACTLVRNHAAMMHGVHGKEIFARLALLAQTLAAAAQAAGSETFPRAQLERMLETVMSDGFGSDEGEASAWTAVDHPGQIFAPADTIIWWGFNSDGAPVHSQPWTANEMSFFSERGVLLEDPAMKMVREAQSWRRPAVAPASRLMLIRPRTVCGREIAAHPLYHEIAEYLEKATAATRAKLVVQADQIYKQESLPLVGRLVKRVLARPALLPSKRSRWRINTGAVAPHKASPSSLERLLGCPLTWSLRYAASIRLGNLLSAVDDERLAGNLAHAVFAEIFGKFSELSDSGNSLEELAAAVFDDLCAKVAAPLLLPGKSLERSRLRRSVCEAVVHLQEMISTARFTDVACESLRTASFNDGELEGRLDMLLSGGGNQDYVIDLKLARKSIYRQREMSEGRAIQLAIYAWLCQHDEVEAGAGYYMLGQKQLLSSTVGPFPKHTYVDGEPLSETFSKIVASYAQHMQHLVEGTIYATGAVTDEELQQALANRVSDAEPELSRIEVPGVTMVLEPPCAICHYGRLCGVKEFAL
jgi:hypothetical protein